MLPADALEQMSGTRQIIAQLGQGPATVRQPELEGRLVGNAHHPPKLGRGQLGRQSNRGTFPDNADSPAVKPVQIGVHRVGMQMKTAGNVHSVEAVGIGQQDFGAPVRTSLVWLFQHLEKPTQLSEGGLTSLEQTWHNQSPCIDGYHILAILTNHSGRILTSIW